MKHSQVFVKLVLFDCEPYSPDCPEEKVLLPDIKRQREEKTVSGVEKRKKDCQVS